MRGSTGLAIRGAVRLIGAGLLAPAVLSTAIADAAAAQATGRVLLYQNPTPIGASELVTYTTCSPASQRPVRLATVGSFDNRPLAGCQVAVLTQAGQMFNLCAGRGIVPPGFRQPARLVIRPGTTAPCAVGNEA